MNKYCNTDLMKKETYIKAAAYGTMAAITIALHNLVIYIYQNLLPL